MADEIDYSKKGKRDLSQFLGQELLYDYAMGSLDPDRQQAIEKFLKNNKEAQNDLKGIRNGLIYIESLKEIKVASSVLEYAKEPNSYLQVMLGKIHFSEWPQGIKMALEALVVSVGVASVAMLVPWDRLKEIKFRSEQEIVLAELSREYEKKDTIIQGQAIKVPDEVFPDEGTATTISLRATTTTHFAAVVKPVVAPPTTALAAIVKSIVAPPATGSADVGTDGKHQGFLFRGTISITNFEAINPKIVEKIGQLGGRKAGEVPIGWRKGTGAYYHFTIPESKYQEVVNAFNEYGKLAIAKEKHERVMPDGIIRLIISVEDPRKSLPSSSQPPAIENSGEQ